LRSGDWSKLSFLYYFKYKQPLESRLRITTQIFNSFLTPGIRCFLGSFGPVLAAILAATLSGGKSGLKAPLSRLFVWREETTPTEELSPRQDRLHHRLRRFRKTSEVYSHLSAPRLDFYPLSLIMFLPQEETDPKGFRHPMRSIGDAG
jgi:hypothetical protein